MSYLWDSNILRHYFDNHPRLFQNLTSASDQSIMVSVVVVAEVLRGRSEALLKAEPAQLARAQEYLKYSQNELAGFEILYFDEKSLAVVERLKKEYNTRKRYGDILIAAQAIAGGHILVTRNVKDFRDLLPKNQIQNWIDDKAR